MKKTTRLPSARMTALKTASCLLLLTAGAGAQAGEGFKLRQPPLGAFGGEIAAPADSPGFFGTAILSAFTIKKVTDADGNDIAVPARSVPLPTGTPTKGAVADGTYTLSIPAGTVDFYQRQSQINLLGGYLTEDTYADGHIAFAANLPLIRQSRTFVTNQAAGTVLPTPPAALPAALRGAIAAVGTAANTQVATLLAANTATQNADVSGIGDTELSMIWIRHQDRLKIAAGLSVFVPTGAYDKNRGPNPGFGDFYTIRPGVALTYALNPNPADTGWDSGVTLAGRVSYGFNTRNKDTDYKSGNFIYGEASVVKVTGNWGFGANLLTIQQTTDDTGTGAPADGSRYKNSSAGPFIAYKLPGLESGFNLHYSQNFSSRNALMARIVQLRFFKAW